MAVIGHHHESVEDERMPFLRPVELFHRFACDRCVAEVWHALASHGCYEHDFLVLDPVALCHGSSVPDEEGDTIRRIHGKYTPDDGKRMAQACGAFCA